MPTRWEEGRRKGEWRAGHGKGRGTARGGAGEHTSFELCVRSSMHSAPAVRSAARSSVVSASLSVSLPKRALSSVLQLSTTTGVAPAGGPSTKKRHGRFLREKGGRAYGSRGACGGCERRGGGRTYGSRGACGGKWGAGGRTTQRPGGRGGGLAAHVFESVSSALASRSPAREPPPAAGAVHLKRGGGFGGVGMGPPAGTVWGVPPPPPPGGFCGVAGGSETLRFLVSCATTWPSTRPC